MAKKNMQFSFVILSWNRAAFLEKCVATLLNNIAHVEQSEIIILDNGSTDRTNEVLNNFAHHKCIKIIKRKKNHGLNSYKKLFNTAKGKYIVVVDDDVLEFPKNIDSVFDNYMNCFTDYGFLALDVVQNEFTNGAKPSAEHYIEETRD